MFFAWILPKWHTNAQQSVVRSVCKQWVYSYFWAQNCLFIFVLFLFIRCPPFLKWVMYDGYNYPYPHPHSYSIMVVFSAHMCMHNAAHIFLKRQILFLVETASINYSLGSVLLWLSRGGVTTKGLLPLKVVFHQRLSSTDGRLPQKVVFHQRSSSTEVCLPRKVVFHRRSSSTEGHPPTKVVSTEGRLPPKVVFWPPSLPKSGLEYFGQNKTNKRTHPQTHMLVLPQRLPFPHLGAKM